MTFADGLELVNNELAFAEHQNVELMGARGNQVISGVGVIPQGPVDLTVDIASGNVLAGGVVVAVGAEAAFAGTPNTFSTTQGNLTSGQAEFVFVHIDSSGVITNTEGGAATAGQQLPPDVPEDEVIIAMITLTEGDATIDTVDIEDWRINVPKGGYVAGTFRVTGAITFDTVLASTNIDVGIADNKIVEIDHANVNSGEYAKFTANGLEGKTFAEIKSDLGLVFGTISNTPAINQSLLTTSDFLMESLEVNQPSGFAGANVEIRNTSGVTYGLEIWDDAASGILDVSVIRLRASGHTVAQLTTSDDWIRFEGSDGLAGAIEGGVVYTTFTGGHNLQSDSYDKKTWKQGMIVISTGELLTDDSIFSTALVKVQLANNISDKRVIGVFRGAKDLLAIQNKRLEDGIKIYNKKIKAKYPNPKDQKLKSYNPILGIIGHDPDKHSLGINALGEGRILVCDKNGIIENGDYITSSDVQGYGIKQDDDVLHNYTVAKITQNINWDDIIPDQDGIKKVLMTCTYHCG